jgi:hypothetical protein
MNLVFCGLGSKCEIAHQYHFGRYPGAKTKLWILEACEETFRPHSELQPTRPARILFLRLNRYEGADL